MAQMQLFREGSLADYLDARRRRLAAIIGQLTAEDLSPAALHEEGSLRPVELRVDDATTTVHESRIPLRVRGDVRVAPGIVVTYRVPYRGRAEILTRSPASPPGPIPAGLVEPGGRFEAGSSFGNVVFTYQSLPVPHGDAVARWRDETRAQLQRWCLRLNGEIERFNATLPDSIEAWIGQRRARLEALDLLEARLRRPRA